MLNVDYSKCLYVMQHTTQPSTLCASPLREANSTLSVEARQNLDPLVAALINLGAIFTYYTIRSIWLFTAYFFCRRSFHQFPQLLFAWCDQFFPIPPIKKYPVS